jgi:hypothetical protein
MSLIAGGIGLQFTAVAKDIPEHALLCSAVTMRCSMVSTSVTDDNTEGLMGAMYACNSSDSTHPQNADALHLEEDQEDFILLYMGLMTTLMMNT